MSNNIFGATPATPTSTYIPTFGINSQQKVEKNNPFSLTGTSVTKPSSFLLNNTTSNPTSFFNTSQPKTPAFSFGKNPTIQPKLTQTNYLGGNNSLFAPSSFAPSSFAPSSFAPSSFAPNGFSVAANGISNTDKLKSEDFISKIKNIIANLDVATDSGIINQLSFRLNCIIEKIYANPLNVSNNFKKMLELSKELECIDSNKISIKFFLKIYAETKNFLQYEDKDWLAKNLFKAALHTKSAIESFAKKDIKCVVAQNFNSKNEVALKFFADESFGCYGYNLGEFGTKENFINSVYFDLSCKYICDFWKQYNPDYAYQIQTKYNVEDFSKSKINITMTQSTASNISLGIDFSMDELFINATREPSHSLEQWFIKLDRLAVALQTTTGCNLNVSNNQDTLCRLNKNIILKVIVNMKSFYETLKVLLKD